MIVGEGVVVKEETAADVKGDEDIDGIMFMCGEYEEDTEHVHHPGESMEVVNVGRSICKIFNSIEKLL